jgi:hypothetical protein
MTKFLTNVKNSRKWNTNNRFGDEAIILKRAILVVNAKAKSKYRFYPNAVQQFFCRMKEHPERYQLHHLT